MPSPELTVLVFDDLGIRHERLQEAAGLLPEARRAQRLAPLTMQADVAYSVADVLTMGPELLAQYDAVFVDFQLSSHDAFGGSSRLSIDLTTQDGTLAPVPVAAVASTGMTVLLRLRNLMETQEYVTHWQARRQRSPAELRDWTSPAGARLFTFVYYAVDTSRLFASAASVWFDAVFFDAGDTVEVMARNLANPKAYPGYGKPERVSQAGDPLTRMLTLDPVGNAAWVQGSNPTGYDWYRLYAHVRQGRRSLDFGTPFRDAFAAKLGQAPRIHGVKQFQLEPWGNRLQDAALDFLRCWEMDDEDMPGYESTSGSEDEDDVDDELAWPAFKWAQQQDPLLAYLQKTALFWDSPDVRLAFGEHLRRTGHAGPT